MIIQKNWRRMQRPLKKMFTNRRESRFNLASPKQLGEVLFDKLKLDPSAKKTKTGQYQTGEDVLTKLAAKGNSIVDDILAFRELIQTKIYLC